MGTLFKDMLASNETLFKNELALDFEFVPKLIPFREQQQQYVASCIKPLFQKRNGRNLVMHGPPGVGKTVAIRHVFRELEETTDEVIPIFINCWQKNTTFKIFEDMCQQLGFAFTQNKNTAELIKIIETKTKGKGIVIAFDEIDKAEDYDFLYLLLERLLSKSILLITNFSDWLQGLDIRIKSRLVPDQIEFKAYDTKETTAILNQRLDYAFFPNVWDPSALKIVADKTTESKDIRAGLTILKEAGLAAEAASSRKILPDHATKAWEKVAFMTPKPSEELEEDTKGILELIKKNSPSKIGDLFAIYQKEGGDCAYRTFQRKIEKLSLNKFIHVKKITGGAEGTTSIISAENKTLDEFS
ncbi:MAG TPA: AAA family ATPase [Candidatus Nanoarchaeia archaeon]|nr:AAA family ATPase [Candidatus Nanoarchaeia archaeon]